MLDSVRASGCCEPLFNCLQHHVAHVSAGNACIGYRRPGDDLAVEGVDDEGETKDLSIPAGELQTVHQRRLEDGDVRRDQNFGNSRALRNSLARLPIYQLFQYSSQS